MLQAVGVPAGAMRRVTESVENPHFIARDYLTVLDQPGIPQLTVENAPFFATRIPAPDVRPAPMVGEHTREVMYSLLGKEDDDTSRLIELDVLQEHLSGEVLATKGGGPR